MRRDAGLLNQFPFENPEPASTEPKSSFSLKSVPGKQIHLPDQAFG